MRSRVLTDGGRTRLSSSAAPQQQQQQSIFAGSARTAIAMSGHNSKVRNPIVQTIIFVIILALLLASGEAAKSCDEPAMPTNKEEWPELTGKTGEDAKAAILKDDSKLQVDVLPEGSMVTMDYRLDRVRVFVDDANVVVSVPRKG